MPDESNTSETADPPGQPTHRRAADSGPQVPGSWGMRGSFLRAGRAAGTAGTRPWNKSTASPSSSTPFARFDVSSIASFSAQTTPDEFRFLGLPSVKDLVPDLGPLGGVHAGLSAMPDEAGFFVACDMPFLNPALIGHMAGFADKADAVVPRIGGYLQPLHAPLPADLPRPCRACHRAWRSRHPFLLPGHPHSCGGRRGPAHL